MLEEVPLPESPVKKAKHDKGSPLIGSSDSHVEEKKEDTINMDQDEEDESSSDAEDSIFSFIKDKSMRKLQYDYYKFCHDSEGFDVLDVCPPSGLVSGMIFRINFENEPEELEITNKCVNFAIQLYNRTKAPKSKLQDDFQIDKVNSNISALTDYYITFTATDAVSGQIDTFQTEVRYYCPTGSMQMHLFRKKGTKKGMLFRADFDDQEDYGRIVKASEFAVMQENTDREAKAMASLQLVNIVKASYRETTNFRTYYITLEAKEDTASGEEDAIETTKPRLYITKMYVGYDKSIQQMDMLLFRPKDVGEKVLWSDDDEVGDDDD